MAVIDSITKARQMGASDEQIVNEILRQNPQKQEMFGKATSMGATPSQILDEIIKQNASPVATPKQEPLLNQNVFGSQAPTNPTFADSLLRPTIGAAFRFGGDIVKSFSSGAYTKQQIGLEGSRKALANSADTLIAAAQQETDPTRKRTLLKLAHDTIKQTESFAPVKQELANEGITTPGQIAQDALNTGATAASFMAGAPTAGSVLGRLAQAGGTSAAIGGAYGAASSMEQGNNAQTVIGDTLKSGLISGVMGIGVQGLGEALRYATNAARQQKLTESALGVPKKLQGTARSPANYYEGGIMTKKGLVNTYGKIAEDANQQVSQILTEGAFQGKTLQTKPILETAKEALQMNFPDAFTPSQVDKMFKQLPIAGLTDSVEMTVPRMNRIRSMIDTKFIGSAKWLNGAKTEETAALMAISDALRTAVQGTDDRLPALFQTWSQAINIKNMAEAALRKSNYFTRLFELSGSATVGAAIGGGINAASAGGAATTMAAVEAARSTPVKLASAAAMRGIQNVLNANGAFATGVRGATKAATLSQVGKANTTKKR